MTNQIRTPEEIEQLKKNWMQDPCWDIEDTEGFEEHYEELKAWHEEYRAERERKSQERDAKRIEKVMLATGLGKADKELLLSLSTFDEIENEASWLQRSTEDSNISATVVLVRATLLQAAQLKRIADALEEIADQDDGTSLINTAKIWGSEQ